MRCTGSIFSAGAASRHKTVPVERSRQMVSSFLPSNAVKNILFCQMHGEEWPAGKGLFQTTFEDGPKNVGGSLPSPTPSPSGPRNCGQLAAEVIRQTNKEHAMRGDFTSTPSRRCSQTESGRRDVAVQSVPQRESRAVAPSQSPSSHSAQR